jgi:hypothetical protein
MFIVAETDLRVFESYSEYGRELREFRRFDELCAAYDVGQDKHGKGSAILLQMWSPSLGEKLRIERIKLRPEKCDGHTFRW